MNNFLHIFKIASQQVQSSNSYKILNLIIKNLKVGPYHFTEL